MVFIDHGHKTGAIVEDIVDESLGVGFEGDLTAPLGGNIFTCEWTRHRGGYYLIGCRPANETHLDVDAVEEFEFCPYCSGEIDMWNAVVDGEEGE